jgi:stage II sporulation protein D
VNHVSHTTPAADAPHTSARAPRRAGPGVRRLVAAATGLAAVAALVAGPSSPASAAEEWVVPRDATIVLPGHGFGHGIGMSQQGAEGAARRGLGQRAIMRHYYPGTRAGQAGGVMRVRITADTTDDLVVRARSGLLVRDLGTRESWRLPANGAGSWRIRVVSGGRTVVAHRSDRWRRWKVLEGTGEFGAGGAPITLVTPSGQKAYRGRLRAAIPVPGSSARDTVNLVGLEAYLRGVVPLEMPALWSPAAVQAQSVAARTYAAYERQHPRARHHHTCDTTSCQVYGGVGAEHPASNAAVAATRGEVRLYDGRPALTMFASSSGGWTAAASPRYLVAKEDPYDDWAGNSVHSWRVRLADEEVVRRFPAIGDLRRIRVLSRTGHGEWGGRVREIVFVGSRGRARVSGDTARSRLGLRSTWFTVRVRG